jgi:hypothetical protein
MLNNYRRTILAALLLLSTTLTHAAVIESGDLNIIDDGGNPSDGLRYLDMSFSDGLTQAAALANAQGTYSNARLTTPSEFDDLLLAAGITYDGVLTASDAFAIGTSTIISSGMNYDGGALSAALGFTQNTDTFIWSDPDGSGGTRDFLRIGSIVADILQTATSPANSGAGWLLVSDAAVSLPAAAWLFGSALLGLGVVKRRKV